MFDWQARYFDFLALLEETFIDIRRTVAKNLSHLLIAFLILMCGEPTRNGRISISAISRAMIVKAKPKNKYKRLNRFLDNPLFRIEEMIPGFFHLVLGKEPYALLPLVFDQTTIRGVEVIYCSVPFAGRALPIGLTTFEYGLIEESQNEIEWKFFKNVIDSLPDWVFPVFILDRGYSRVDLMHRFKGCRGLFILRGRQNVSVRVGRRWVSLGRLRHREGRAKRYRNVLLRRYESVLVDVIVYREKGFKEPWFLVVPSGCEGLLPTERVVALYRERMQIEVKFRDLKTHLGVRGLRLEVRKGKRLGRLLTGLALVYIILVALGAGKLGDEIRPLVEVLRPQPRHGTRQTLSVLLIGCRLLTDPFLIPVKTIINTLKALILLAIQGKGFISITNFQPP